MSLPVSTTLVPLQGASGGGGAGGAGALGALLVPLIVFVIVVAGMWKAFEKADEPGWAALIPIYNVYKMIQISGNAWWWLLLFFVPLLNLIAALKISIDVAEAFGQGLLFGLGLTFLAFIFWPLLGFGDYDYGGAPA